MAEAQTTAAQLRIERIYLKDASFESPGAPSIFNEQLRTDLKIDINHTVNSLGDQRHEVVLSVTATSQRDDERTAFVAEIHQAGIFHIEGVNDGQLQQVLSITCPHTLFLYLRESLDALVIKGGFPALRLSPINFEALYAEALRHAQPPPTTH